MTGETRKAIVAFTLLLIVFFTVLRVPEWNAEPVAQESMKGIARALFTTYVVPFLALAVLLTGALFGALYMGMKPRESDEEGDEP